MTFLLCRVGENAGIGLDMNRSGCAWSFDHVLAEFENMDGQVVDAFGVWGMTRKGMP